MSSRIEKILLLCPSEDIHPVKAASHKRLISGHPPNLVGKIKISLSLLIIIHQLDLTGCQTPVDSFLYFPCTLGNYRNLMGSIYGV